LLWIKNKGVIFVKFKFFIALILVLFVFALSGCSGTNDPVPPVDPPGEDTPIDAKALIDNNCAQCHGLNTVYTDRDKDQWPKIVADMAQRARYNFSGEEVDAMTQYLQENYSN
jgi:mono/diheme cytochrome c family protein